MKLVSKGFVDGFYYKPRVDYEVLETYHEGIIALSACLAGEVQRYLARGMYEEAMRSAKKYEAIYGKGNFFLELQDHGLPEQRMVNQGLLRLSQETGIDLVATNDIHYTYAEDAQAHDILLCIQTGKKWRIRTGCAMKAGSITASLRRKCALCSPMRLRPWTIPIRLPSGAMWRSSSGSSSCQSTMCPRALIPGPT